MTRRQIHRQSEPTSPPGDKELVFPGDPDPEWIERHMSKRFKYAMQLKDDLHLTDEQRYELAQMIPGVDKDYGGSWKDLNMKQLHDLITMMEGYTFINFMKEMEA